MNHALVMSGLDEDTRCGGADARQFCIDLAGEHLNARLAGSGGLLGTVDMHHDDLAPALACVKGGDGRTVGHDPAPSAADFSRRIFNRSRMRMSASSVPSCQVPNHLSHGTSPSA